MTFSLEDDWRFPDEPVWGGVCIDIVELSPRVSFRILPFFTGVLSSFPISVWLRFVGDGPGDDDNCLDGSTAGGLGDRWWTWVASSASKFLLRLRSRCWLGEIDCSVIDFGATIVYGVLRLLGVWPNTSANLGVQAKWCSEGFCSRCGVWKWELSYVVEVGVALGVGGWAFGNPKLWRMSIQKRSN